MDKVVYGYNIITASAWYLVCTHYITSNFTPQGFVPAINALAWYYEQFEQDYRQAVQLWEQADLLESADAALNLGVMYSQGLYPGKAADQVNSALSIYCYTNARALYD